MKVALLLPGYLDSPDYLHLVTFEKRLTELGYTAERIDPCHLWETGDVRNYTLSHYLEQVGRKVAFYSQKGATEIVLIGHSLGGFCAILAGARMTEVTKIVALCPPPDIKIVTKTWDTGLPRKSQRDLPNDPTQSRSFSVPYAFLQDALQYSAQEEVKKISKPLMILIALNDETVLPATTEQIVTNAKDPHVVRLPNMGHSFRRSQEETDVVMGEIEKFLASS